MYCVIVLNQNTRFKTKAQVTKPYFREEIYYYMSMRFDACVDRLQIKVF